MNDFEYPEEHLQFPCQFPLKLIGLNSADFLEDMIQLVGRHVPPDDQEPVITHPSGKGRYISITFHFTARSREQVDDLYQEISTDKRVLYAL